jgi:hypothetical protein
MDIVYLAVIGVFFLLTGGLVRLCEGLGTRDEGGRS